MTGRPLSILARALLALFRGEDADVVRGDIEEAHRRRLEHSRTPRAADRALIFDALRSLASWWSPGTLLRRHARSRRLPRHRRDSTMSNLWSELRLTVRGLARRPAFTLTVLLTLGFGIGATTTIYSVVDAVVVRPLPYDGADRLVAVGNTFAGREWDDRDAGLQHLAGVALLNFQEWERRARSFERLGAAELSSALLPDQGAGPELAPLAMVTDGFFEVLRVRPLMGRSFLPDDFAGRSGQVSILSYNTWMNRFGGDPEILSHPTDVFGGSITVVGVLPSDFVAPESFSPRGVEFWTPLDASHPRYAARGRRSLAVYGRLAPGATLDGARAEMDAIQASLATEFPDGNVMPNGDRLGAGANTLQAETIGGTGRLLALFLGASALLLLIAALNAANLLLVRGLDRQGEMGVRRALGATRGRLSRTLFLESIVLAAAGGTIGVALAFVGVKAFLLLAPTTLPRLGEVAVNPRVVGMSALVSLGAGLIVGLLPALRLTGRDIATTIRQRTEGNVAQPGTRLRSAIIAGQLGVAVMLAVGASLLMNSFIRIAAMDPGFQPARSYAFSLGLKRPNAPPDETTWQAWDGLLEQVRSVPGVDGAAAASNLPYQSPNWAPPILLPEDPSTFVRAGIAGYVITPDFFDVASMPLVAGRPFAKEDRAGAPNVMIVNQQFVREHLGGREPLGLQLRYRDDAGTVLSAEVVGVVANVVQERAEEGWRSAVYVPYGQIDWPIANVLVRSTRSAETLLPELRSAVARFSPYVPIAGLSAMEARVSSVQAEPRFRALLIGSFAIVAILLAAIGLYGTLAYTVARRRREIGIRMALGAEAAGIFRLVLRQGIVVTSAGLAIGIGGSLLLTKLLDSFLFRIEALDPMSFAAAVLVLGAAALVACVIPARRATDVDVVESLRAE